MDHRSPLVRLSDNAKRRHRDALFIALVVLLAVSPDGQLEVGREGIDDGNSHPVEPPGYLIGVFVKLASRMEYGHNDLRRRSSRFVVLGRYAASVVCHGYAAVFVDRDIDSIAEACERFVYRVVHNFVDKMVQPSGSLVSDIHPRPFSYGLEPFKHVYVFCGVFEVPVHG